MKAILLIVQSKFADVIEEPGLASLAAVLTNAGHEVEVKRVPFENETVKICDYINDNNIIFVGISTYDRYFYEQIKLAKIIKDKCRVYICLGGYTASYHSEHIMQEYPFIDYLIKGEGEVAMVKLINSLSGRGDIQDIEGLSYRNENNEIVINEGCQLVKNLDELPFVDRSILKMQNNNMFHMTTSRGCTSACSFCCSSDFWRNSNNNRVYRAMSPKRVVDEIEYVVKHHNKCRVVFTDNSYEDAGNNTSRQIEIAELLLQRNIHIWYSVNYRVNFYKYANEEFMNKMIKSGLTSVFLGVESGNQHDLDLYNKRTTISDCKMALYHFKQFKPIAVMIGFISLNPYSTLNRLHENIEFLKNFDYANNIANFTSKLIPFKGTAIYKQIQNDGLLLKQIDTFTSSFVYKHPEIQDIEDYFNSVLIEYPEIKNSGYICGVFPTILSFLENYIRFRNDDKALNILSKYKKEFDLIDKSLNNKNYEWVTAILDTPKNKEAVTDKFLKYGDILNLYREKVKLRNKLYMDLVRLDNHYLMCF